MNRIARVLAALSVAVVLLAGGALPGHAASGVQVPAKSATSPSGALANDLTFTPAKAKSALKKLKVRATYNTGYDRKAFPHWKNASKYGWTTAPKTACNTRAAALYRDGTVNTTRGTCTVANGNWKDPYSGKTFKQANQIDVDHVVPLAAAWRSGAWKWTEAKREKFANSKLVLVISSASENRSKSDQTPATWKPTLKSSWCAYATRWVQIKKTWKLTLESKAEKANLSQMLRTCGKKITKGTTTTTSQPSSPTPTKPTPPKKAGSASPNGGNCPADYPIKANVNSGIYHVPGGAYYSRTTSNIRCYANETNAQNDGFRRSSR